MHPLIFVPVPRRRKINNMKSYAGKNFQICDNRKWKVKANSPPDGKRKSKGSSLSDPKGIHSLQDHIKTSAVLQYNNY